MHLFRLKILALLLTLLVTTSHCLIDPVSIGIGATLLGFGYNWQTVKKHTYCRLNECCNENWVPGKISELKKQLESNLFGQHIVMSQLIPALDAHFSPGANSKKPLVISFHGTPGTGKNFVSDMIARSLYKEGLNSQYVHKFLGRSDFPLQSQSDVYKMIIKQRVFDGITSCPQSLFIFDEVDKMPAGVFESVASLLDHHSQFRNMDYSKAVFIFLSNTGGVELSDRLSELMRYGAMRDDTQMHDFERILEVGAYNLEGGLKKSSIIESHLIDHFIPFLPLEKRHVERCVRKEFTRWNIRPTEKDVQDIITNFVTFDRNTGLFATSGCKTLEKKVDVVAKSGRY